MGGWRPDGNSLTGNLEKTNNPKTTSIIEKTAATTGLLILSSVMYMIVFYYCDLIIGFTFIPGLTFVNPSAIILSPSTKPSKISRLP